MLSPYVYVFKRVLTNNAPRGFGSRGHRNGATTQSNAERRSRTIGLRTIRAGGDYLAMEPGQPPSQARRATFSIGKTTAIRDVQSPLGFAVFFTLILDGFGAMVAIWAPLPE